MTADRHGTPDSAFAFDGDDSILVPEDSEAFNIGSDGFTMALWVLFDSDAQTSSYPNLIGYGGYSSNGWNVFRSNTKLAAALRSDTDQSCSRYVDMVNHQGKWVHYAFTYENGTFRAFRDGGRVGENNCPDYHPSTGHSLVIGASSRYDGRVGGIVAQIDEVRFYSRVLSDLEIATLSEDEQALDAARKGTIFHANFEEGLLEPEQHDYGLDINDVLPDDAIRVVENPERDSVNDSERVMMVQTAPSPADSHTRAEYTSNWPEPFVTNGHRHTYQWMVYFPEDFLIGMDEIRGDWLLITQFVTHPCAWLQDGFDNAICYSGGIFNEARINGDDYNAFMFQYRAAPDCNTLDYTYPRGEWIKFTYDLHWTTESNGFYALWANETLIGHAEGVQTLPEGFVDGTCDIRWKVGLYDSWTDSELEEIHYYIDNLELYLDGDVTTICPGCTSIK